MKFSSTPSIAFGLSHLLGEKMRLSHLLSSTDSTSVHPSPPSAYLVTRCPSFTAPQLDQNDACSCRAPDSGLALCPTVPGSRSNAICVEDLRDGQRVATCGIEYHSASAWASLSLASNPAGDEDTSEETSREYDEGDESDDDYGDQDDEDDTFRCPDGFHRLVTGPDAFLCQDSASPHSCGILHTDCMRAPGALQSECVFGECEIAVCKEGWRFKVSPESGAQCVPATPFFFNS